MVFVFIHDHCLVGTQGPSYQDETDVALMEAEKIVIVTLHKMKLKSITF